MQTVRPHLAWIVRAWLLCQAAVLTMTPVTLCAGLSTRVAGQECTCSHGDGQVCPMHHATTTKSSCSCRSAADGLAAIVFLLGQVAVLPQSIDALEPAATSDAATWSEPVPLDRFLVPDPPPPRASHLV
jgi:hypothetical protein